MKNTSNYLAIELKDSEEICEVRNQTKHANTPNTWSSFSCVTDAWHICNTWSFYSVHSTFLQQITVWSWKGRPRWGVKQWTVGAMSPYAHTGCSLIRRLAVTFQYTAFKAPERQHTRTSLPRLTVLLNSLVYTKECWFCRAHFLQRGTKSKQGRNLIPISINSSAVCWSERPRDSSYIPRGRCFSTSGSTQDPVQQILIITPPTARKHSISAQCHG